MGRPDVLEATNGIRFAVHAARALTPTGVGVVVLPDARGLHQFYREVAERFAEMGIDAVAVDYFGRTAGVTERPVSFDFQSHKQQTTPEGLTADVEAAVDLLRSWQGGAPSAVFLVGFCFGGGHSWRLAADLAGISGAIGFYGNPSLAAGIVGRTHAPLLMLAAGVDAQIPVGDVQDFADSVRASGGDVDVIVYAGAPHSFFDRAAAEHQEACRDAWERVQKFMIDRSGSTRLKGRPAAT